MSRLSNNNVSTSKYRERIGFQKRTNENCWEKKTYSNVRYSNFKGIIYTQTHKIILDFQLIYNVYCH